MSKSLKEMFEKAARKPKTKAITSLQHEVRKNLEGRVRKVAIPSYKDEYTGRKHKRGIQEVSHILMGGRLVTVTGDVFQYRTVKDRPYDYEAIV